MGVALSRHPRNSYFIATKLSNQRDKSREGSLAIYRKSLEDLKVDYFDYYLLHPLGTVAAYKERYLDNGMLDFVLKERHAGRNAHNALRSARPARFAPLPVLRSPQSRSATRTGSGISASSLRTR